MGEVNERWRQCRDEQCRSKQQCDAAPFPCSAPRFTGDLLTVAERNELERLRWLYEGCARVLAREAGFDPLNIISDGGHQVWQMHGYQVACKEMGRKEKGRKEKEVEK